MNHSSNQISVGEGTPGKRVKGAWRAEGRPLSLRSWARLVSVDKARDDAAVCSEWLASKRYGGTDEQRKERLTRRRERRSANLAAQAARRAKRANKQKGREQ